MRALAGTVLRRDDFDERLAPVVVDVVEAWATYGELFADADVVLVLVDGPKDDDWEPRFFECLLARPPRRRQLAIVDFIRIMPLVRAWRAFPAPKFDRTSFGHSSGTGLLLRRPA